MYRLIVGNVTDDVVRALERRAARNGRSAEAEHREILRSALADDIQAGSFKAFLLTMPDAGLDADFAPLRDIPRDMR